MTSTDTRAGTEPAERTIQLAPHGRVETTVTVTNYRLGRPEVWVRVHDHSYDHDGNDELLQLTPADARTLAAALTAAADEEDGTTGSPGFDLGFNPPDTGRADT